MSFRSRQNPRFSVYLQLFILIRLALSGCSGITATLAPTPTSTPTKTPTPIPTPTPSPTPTPRPIGLTVLHTNDTWGYSEPCG